MSAAVLLCVAYTRASDLPTALRGGVRHLNSFEVTYVASTTTPSDTPLLLLAPSPWEGVLVAPAGWCCTNRQAKSVVGAILRPVRMCSPPPTPLMPLVGDPPLHTCTMGEGGGGRRKGVRYKGREGGEGVRAESDGEVLCVVVVVCLVLPLLQTHTGVRIV